MHVPAEDTTAGRHSERGQNIALAEPQGPEREMVKAGSSGWVAEKRGWDGLAPRRRHKDGSWRYLESNAMANGRCHQHDRDSRHHDARLDCPCAPVRAQF